MKILTKIATSIGCLSFALIGGFMLTACDSKPKEISVDVFSAYINQPTTALNFDKCVHGVIQEDINAKTEFWILKNDDNTYSLKQIDSILDGMTWTNKYTYAKNGYLYQEKDGRKIYSKINEYSGEEFKFTSCFDINAMENSIENLIESATKFTETVNKDNKTYEIIDQLNEKSIKISFNDDKLVKYQYSAMIEGVEMTMEEFNQDIDFSINYDQYYQKVYNFKDLKEAIKKDNKILVADDIELEETLTIDKIITLDLDNHYITISSEIMFSSPSMVDDNLTKTWSMFAIEGGNLTIEGNGSIKNYNGLAIFSVGYNGFGENKVGASSGMLTILGGTFINESDYTDEENDFKDTIIYVENGTVSIEGGYFGTLYGNDLGEDEIYQAKKNMFNINEESVDSKIVIKGGEFEYYKPQESGFLDENYQANNNDDIINVWTVTKK